MNIIYIYVSYYKQCCYEQSRMCLLLYVCTSLSKVLLVNDMYNYLIHNHCRDNKDSTDEAVGLKY